MYYFDDQYIKQKEIFLSFMAWLLNRAEVKDIKEPTIEEDIAGIDLICRFKDKELKFQVKTDFKTSKTGNLAIETISQAGKDNPAKLGWMFELPIVDYLAYICGDTGDVFVYKAKEVMDFTIENYQQFRNFKAENKEYFTLGVLVPQNRLDHLCIIKSNVFDLTPSFLS